MGMGGFGPPVSRLSAERINPGYATRPKVSVFIANNPIFELFNTKICITLSIILLKFYRRTCSEMTS